jgi:hypothetical protein
MVCYLIIITIKLHWLLDQVAAGSGAGRPDLQGLGRLESAVGSARGARTGNREVVTYCSTKFPTTQLQPLSNNLPFPDHFLTTLLSSLAITLRSSLRLITQNLEEPWTKLQILEQIQQTKNFSIKSRKVTISKAPIFTPLATLVHACKLKLSLLSLR